MKQSILEACKVLYLDHVAVTTPDFKQTVVEYLNLPGASLVKGPGWNARQKVEYAFIRIVNGPMVEVLGAVEDSPINKHIEKGGGAYHFCYAVADIEESIRQAKNAGAKVIVEPIEDIAFDERKVAFLFSSSQGIFELVEAYPNNLLVEWKTSAEDASKMKSELGQPKGSEIKVEKDVRERLCSLFAKTFPLFRKELTGETEMNQLKGWDSLGQLQLIMEVEQAFEVSFSANEVLETNSFEKILALLLKNKMIGS
jgi:acyl carrier protein/predicted enzyme related to lactoylglutathione lyase